MSDVFLHIKSGCQGTFGRPKRLVVYFTGGGAKPYDYETAKILCTYSTSTFSPPATELKGEGREMTLYKGTNITIILLGWECN